jgi:hypothetical protein
MRSNRRLALLGLCALVGVALIGGLIGFGVGGGGGSSLAMPTTGAYAPISVPTPITPHLGFGGALAADPDSMIRQGQDLQIVISREPGRNHYKLTVTNVSGIGFINSFHWLPPTGVNILKVTGSSSGQCDATGTSGFGGKQFQTVVLNPEILCDGVNLKPPTCTCSGDGGQVSVSFVASQPVGLGGAARVDSATPVLAVIPSSPQPPQSPDLALCTPGQVSTKAKPCAPA